MKEDLGSGCPHHPHLPPPKPAARPEPQGWRGWRLFRLWRYLRLFRQDILSAQPARLYRAWMAEFRTPFFRSYLCNDPEILAQILREAPQDFPKSDRVRAGLEPLLGQSVFVTNGALWARQRRIIDPAFAGGRLKETFPALRAAGEAMVARLEAARAHSVVQEVEPLASHAAADVIFRTLFSLPIDHAQARAVFEAFQTYQRSQPLINLRAFIPLPKGWPRLHRARTRKAAGDIRRLITALTFERAEAIKAGRAPEDLATKIMTLRDPETGEGFAPEEMVDQVAIFFLAGHETSASALSWALYLLAADAAVQAEVAAEVRALPEDFDFSAVAGLSRTRDVFREALRLYPPVPMMVREALRPTRFRGRVLARGAQIVLSPWHLHRHERLWTNPDAFCPARWQGPEAGGAGRRAYLPFSAGPRICPGAGFAMIEGVLLIALILRRYRLEVVEGKVPVPVAHLTVRSKDGIFLRVLPRI